jgi:RimJ/RimL family protein N-acetyltransferase
MAESRQGRDEHKVTPSRGPAKEVAALQDARRRAADDGAQVISHRTAMPAATTILTPRLQLSAVTRADGWELWELWNKPAVRDALFGAAALSIDRAMALVDVCRERDGRLWAVRSPLTTRLLGCVSLCGWPQASLAEDAAAAEFSMAMLPSVQGRGYGFEAASAVLEQTIRAAQVDAVHASVRRGDAHGLSLIGRLGFRATAERLGRNGPCIDFSLSASTFFSLLRARAKLALGRPTDHLNDSADAPLRDVCATVMSARRTDDFLDTDVMLEP